MNTWAGASRGAGIPIFRYSFMESHSHMLDGSSLFALRRTKGRPRKVWVLV